MPWAQIVFEEVSERKLLGREKEVIIRPELSSVYLNSMNKNRICLFFLFLLYNLPTVNFFSGNICEETC